MSKSDHLFYTDWPMYQKVKGRFLKGPCMMNTINNAIQAELFSSCNTTRQIQSKAFQKRYSDTYPGKDNLEVYLEMQYELAGLEGGVETKAAIMIIESMGYWVDRHTHLFDDYTNRWQHSVHHKYLMPDIKCAIDDVEEEGAHAVIMGVFKYHPNEQDAKERHFHEKNVSNLHAICIRRIGNSWWILDGNYNPKAGWAEMKFDTNPDIALAHKKWRSYLNHIHSNAMTMYLLVGHRHGKGRHCLDTGAERMVRRFVRARKEVGYMKQLGPNKGIKACSGCKVPYTEYTYTPPPRQQDCKSGVQLKYGPSCKMWRKCISAATRRKAGL